MSSYADFDSASPDRSFNTDRTAGLSGIVNMHFSRGAVIYRAGTEFNGIYMVNDGMAKAELPFDGQVVLTSLALRGDILGLDSFHNTVYETTALCVSDLNVTYIPAACFYLLLKTSEPFRLQLACAIGKAVKENNAIIRLLSDHDTQAKVVYLLLKVFLASADARRGQRYFNLELSRAEMGQFLGLRMETISRHLSNLTSLGLIAVQGRRIHVRDYEELRQRCKSLSTLM